MRAAKTAKVTKTNSVVETAPKVEMGLMVVESPIQTNEEINFESMSDSDLIQGLTRALYQFKYGAEVERLVQKTIQGQFKYFETTLIPQIGTKLKASKKPFTIANKNIIRDEIKAEMKRHLIEIAESM